MNMVHISGHIGAEPEFKEFESGKRKVSFSVALNNNYSKDREQNDTTWIPCLAWDAVYDRLLRCKEKAKLSGRKINVTGSFVQNSWTDQANGKKRTKLMVKILFFELIGAAPQEPSQDHSLSESDSVSDAELLFDGKPLNQPRRRSSGRTKASG